MEQNETTASKCLEVTQVQVFPFKEGLFLGSLRALAQIVLNDQLIIRGLRVLDGESGLYVGYPADPFYRGEDFRSVCNPLTRELRERIDDAVLAKYREAVI